MTTRVLMVGDIQLGRRPQRLAEAGLDPRRYSPAEAWRLSVDLAIDEQVHAVVLAGDVIDDARDRFEAYGLLEREAKRLVDAGIQMFAVAGNHDGIALPQLASRLSGFKLLGLDGQWECAEVSGPTPVDLLGWSFPTNHFDSNPLRHGDLRGALGVRRTEAALLGVLHADIDATSSKYAPVPRAGLESVDVDGWFLGHIHRPDDLRGPRPIGYLGSVVGLHQGEAGAHGPWLVEVEGRGRITSRQMVLGPVRWETLDVDVSHIPNDARAADVIHTAIDEAVAACVDSNPELTDTNIRVLAWTARLVGSPSAPGHVRGFIDSRGMDELRFDGDDQVRVVVAVRDHTRPPVDLEALSRESTPVGLLAQLLLDLDRGADLPEDLGRALGRVTGHYTSGPWRLDSDRWTPPTKAQALEAASRQALDMLLTQRSGD